MSLILLSLSPLLSLGVFQPPQEAKVPPEEKSVTFQGFEFQTPKAWKRAKPEGKKIRWVLQGQHGKDLSMSLEPLKTKLSPQQYLMDRFGRLGRKSNPKYYGGNSTGITFLGIEFNMQAGKEKPSQDRALIAVFQTNKGLIRFVATGEETLFLKQRPSFKRLLFTFRVKGKPLPQRQVSPKPSSPTSRPSTSPSSARSKPTSVRQTSASPIKKGWLQTKVRDLVITYPKAWIKTKPSNNMRLLELHIKGKAGEGVLSAYYFGPSSGSIRMNLDRWKGQFSDPKNVVEKELNQSKHKTILLSLDGNYGGGMSGAKTKGRSRIFAWITKTAKGPFYFKLVGPKKTVDAWEKDLMEVAKRVR